MTKIVLAIAWLAFIAPAAVHGQSHVKRTLSRSDKFDFSPGGTVSITGSPTGSIKVVGTNRSEVEINAEVTLSAATEADVAAIADVTGFVVDKSIGRATIISVGTHNKLGDKNAWKKFPKKLLGLPFRVDYTISVPRYVDMEIDGGNGDLEISGVEGTMRINFLDTHAKVEVISGGITAIFGSGSADIAFGTKGWRGRPAAVQMGNGDLTVRLPVTTSADIDATILTTGKIANELSDLKPRDAKVPFTDRSVIARAGVGGAQLKLTIAQGSLTLTRYTGSL